MKVRLSSLRGSTTFQGTRLWLVFTVLAALSWGFWGVLTKLVSGDVNPYGNHFLFSAGMLITLPFILRKCSLKEVNWVGIAWGAVGGILAVIGNVAVYKSYSLGGQASVVIPITNLYPVGTILIALLVFRERLHWMNGIGIVIVVPAILMLSGQTQVFRDPRAFFAGAGPGSWLLFSFLALFLYIMFSAIQKVTARYISAVWSYLTFVAVCLIGSACFLAAGLIEFEFSGTAVRTGLFAGAVDGMGILSIFAAYRAGGKAAKVSSIAAMLQQLFTIILAAVLLAERLNWTGYTGIFLAILASFFLTFEVREDKA